MKKQLLIAAVAATMTSAAFADISISGNAKYEYKNIEDVNNSTTNTGHTEVNLNFVGKSGDTTVVLNSEYNGAGAVDSGATSGLLDIEDMYMTTKIGDFTIKAGDYTTGTSAIIGEIDNGSRSTDKVGISTSVGGAKIAYSTTPGAGASDSVTVSMPVAGFDLTVKESPDSYTAFGISGDVAGVGVRLEQQNSDTANSDVTFGNITKEVNGITLGYAWISADDAATTVTEDDSAIFAVEMATTGAASIANVNGVQQLSAKTSLAGNTVTFKAGSLSGEAGYQDADFTQVDVKRALASGATLQLTYTSADKAAVATGTTMTDTATLEADLSVKF